MIRQFRGALITLVVLVLAVTVFLAYERAPAPLAQAPAVFRFDKEALVAFEIDRRDGTLAFRRAADGSWETVDGTFRPSRSMIRRVAHQLHDLDARATVVPEGTSSEPYGFEERGIAVRLVLADGRTIAFDVGGANATAVSWYLRTKPDGKVYVVKKSAMDFWGLPTEAFREDRVAAFDAADVARVEATVGSERRAIARTGPRAYWMEAPIPQEVSREHVETLLGRLSALRALAFVADAPADLAPFGLAKPEALIAIHFADGTQLDLRVSALLADGDEPTRRVYHQQDDAVYLVKAGFLDPFYVDASTVRSLDLVLRDVNVARTLRATRGEETVELHKTSDSWRWPDGSVVAGSTPDRVALRASHLVALQLHDEAVDLGTYGLDPPKTTVHLTLDDGSVDVLLGERFERLGERITQRQYAQVGDRPVASIEGGLQDAVDDLFREYGRFLARGEGR